MRNRSTVIGILFVPLLIFLAACSALEGLSSQLPETTITPDAIIEATQPPSAGIDLDAENLSATTPTPAPPGNLVVWAVADANGLDILESQISAYGDLSSNISPEIIFDLKAASGPGGIQRYLETGPGIAPSILPDLILVPFSLLPQFVEADLVFPLSPYIDDENFDDLFPAGRTISRVGEEFFGYPYSFTDFHHVVYNREIITGTFPLEWESFVTLPAQFVFAGTGNDGVDMLLMLYLAEGGTLRDETGNIRLEEEPLRQALMRLANALESELIYPGSGQLSTESGTWDAYLNGSANVIWTDSQVYRTQSDQVTSSAGFASLPGSQGPIPARTRGYVWVIATENPERQRLAADLLTYLTNPENMGSLNQQSLGLPTRRSALDTWSQDEYTNFLRDQLDAAAVYPTAALGPVSDALSAAVRTLLLSSNPQAAIPDIARTTVSAVP